MPPFYQGSGSSLGLQSILSQGSSESSLVSEYSGPHYPICCTGEIIRLHEDGTLSCEHSSAGPDHPRNQVVIDASVAILLIELAVKEYG